MAWTTPRTWTTGEIVTAAYMNTHVRDNLLETAPAKVTTLGDLIIGSGAGAIKRLGRGSAHAVLGVNSSGTDLAWSTPHLNDYSNHIPYAITGGTSTAYTVTLSPAPSSMAEGFGISIKIHTTCGTSPTLNVNGLGAKVLKSHFGNAYVSGELVAGRIYSFRYNGTDFLADSAGGLDSYFGTGADGVFNSGGSTSFASTYNGYFVIRNYTSFTLNIGHSLTVTQPCSGLIIYCTGDVTINGTISMSNLSGRRSYPTVFLSKDVPKFYYLSHLLSALYFYGGPGGNGGNGGIYTWSGMNYITGAGYATGEGRIGNGGGGGGGGAGGIFNHSTMRYETGGGGGDYNYCFDGIGQYGTNRVEIINNVAMISGVNGATGDGGGGAGGSSSTSYTVLSGGGGRAQGGGGGGGGGAYQTSSTAPNINDGVDGDYGGGFVCIIARGNVTIGSGGKIEANGGNGGAGGNGSATGTYAHAGGAGGGGGSGGGVILIRFGSTFTNSGTLQVNAGIGGAAGIKSGTYGLNGESGSSGTAGTISAVKVTT